MKEKYEEIIGGLQKNFEIGDGLEITKNPDMREAEDLNEMIGQLKEKMENAKRTEKTIILSVLPKSWSANKIQKQFNVWLIRLKKLSLNVAHVASAKMP